MDLHARTGAYSAHVRMHPSYSPVNVIFPVRFKPNRGVTEKQLRFEN